MTSVNCHRVLSDRLDFEYGNVVLWVKDLWRTAKGIARQFMSKKLCIKPLMTGGVYFIAKTEKTH